MQPCIRTEILTDLRLSCGSAARALSEKAMPAPDDENRLNWVRDRQEQAMSGVPPDRAKLARLLAKAGSALDVAGAEAVITGVLAAPPEIGTSWHALIAEPTPPDLADALDAWQAALAADHRDGVQPEDF